ncbi:hypothetical protein [Bacillus toyonensis]|uniref:hypothetical protein n=1 Tax=Bacillus toyonensis TaxID=155322 RepID=UPI002E1B8DCD|nr:hypothetical protein [Bacillus toyonensis]
MKPTVEYDSNKEEYRDQSKEIADLLYDRVKFQAIKNGSVGETWIQTVFDVNYLTAAWIISRMYDEEICGEYDPSIQHRRIL